MSVLFANVPCPGFDRDAETLLRCRKVSDYVKPSVVYKADLEAGTRQPVEENTLAEIADYLLMPRALLYVHRHFPPPTLELSRSGQQSCTTVGSNDLLCAGHGTCS